MKFYYTLTCVVLPAAMMAACSASGSKKPVTNTTDIAVTKQEVLTTQKKPITPLAEKIEAVESTVAQIREDDKFPLTQLSNEIISSKPIKRIYQFGFNKQEISQSEMASLEEHADYLIAHSNTTLIINGHSDTQGNQAYNQFLSHERAKKVARFLIEYGVAESQIKVNGLGDSQPLNDVNSFKENRRVELEYQSIPQDSRVAIK